MQKITEQESKYHHLEKTSTGEILRNMNAEDKSVAGAVEKCIPLIELLVDVIADKMLSGGRLFYIGAGTSGRLGIVDASECPPTFGVPQGLVIGIIAGGDGAIRKAVEHAEDDKDQGWDDLLKYNISNKDIIIGIAASGTTPYVVGALKKCREEKIITACITCNHNAPVAEHADHKIEIIVGPEFITGSTRLKSGTAQKLCLNMISTAVMIKLGRVEDNKMVDMLLTNDKLIDRGTNMVMEKLNIDYDNANKLLLKEGSVRKAIENKR
ncbi:MAG: N-acetylmuramic acid 6-phosphate etherase [Fimbriimonadaceae bacterium]|nr:N-acetylmuramic acid 6-phosphate etherase [Chitinophagales bacterium]